jgi:hypothetical protein
VNQPSQVRVVLDLETEGEQIQGSMSADGDSGLRFVGWLQLASRLERMRKCLPERTGLGPEEYARPVPDRDDQRDRQIADPLGGVSQ